MTDASADQRLTPDYARPEASRGVNVRVFQAAVFCGAIPMVAVIVGTVLFWLTRSQVPLMLGLIGLCGWLPAFLIGLGFLVKFATRVWGDDRTTFRAWRGRIGLAFVLLCANLPVAGACVMAVEYCTSIYRVTVRNVGTTRIDSLEVWWADGLRELGPIPPGATATAKFAVEVDGPLEFREARGTAVKTDVLARVAGRFMGHDLAITSADAAIAVNGTAITPTILTGPGSPTPATAPSANP